MHLTRIVLSGLILCAVCLATADNESGTMFTVSGIVRDLTSAPVEGARVRANCGLGTLLPTGETTSAADGRYVLHFRPGARMAAKGGGKVGLQAATIVVEKPGCYEVNFSRQGNLGMADAMPSAEGRKLDGFVGVVLPYKPYAVDFTLAPAATLMGRIVDGNGHPVSTTPQQGFVCLCLNAETLRPSSSAWANIAIDSDGKFAIGNVPLQPVWFQYRDSEHPREIVSERLNVAEPTTCTVRLRIERSGPNTGELRMDVIR